MKLRHHNSPSEEYELSCKEILDNFIFSNYNKEVISSRYSLVLYLSSKGGLNSSFIQGDFEKLFYYLERDMYKNQINFKKGGNQ